MPQVEITIGGREFVVACQSGEEPYLQAAARLLDEEASGLAQQSGRMPESKMLLMAGLMLADRAAGLEDRLRQTESYAGQVEKRLSQTEAALNKARTDPQKVEVEVPVIPHGLIEMLAEMTARAEALAERVEKAGV
ncbi:MAG: cell division protein ZapA [Limimaricola soesokkakensis]|uniref:Cell division protein ZapA n=1 Tax=Limimaricola soesokkakensis TaxID=1343159 RepID=A0A1X6YY76_9RHOB|nr:cell division protein ZapA [Limimaricola soesokkakensis]PSK87821.1 cell division protein ZapA [Limimaricola soesokkakensis]SLN34820.1 Cell division protein ZapA [Limimaricola soesokkakensis]